MLTLPRPLRILGTGAALPTTAVTSAALDEKLLLPIGTVERKTGVTQDSDISAGTLFSSGLIAGGSICGILYAVLVGTQTIGPFQMLGNAVPWFHGETGVAQIGSALLFLALAFVTARMAKRTVL